MMDSRAIREARAQVESNRNRLMGTIRDLQTRASPKTIARDTWQGAKEKGAELADGVVGTVAERPVMTGVIASAVALFIVRKPLMNWAGRLFDRNDQGGSIDQ